MKSICLLLIISIVKNSFCIEEPSYQVLKKFNNNVEIRKYSPSKWVGNSVNIVLNNYRGSNQLFPFLKLSNYISGSNDQKKKIEMTAPLLIDFKNCNEKNVTINSKCDVSMKFYVPKENQENTPNPTDAKLFFANEPELTVAVIRFGGFPSVLDNFKRRDELLEELGTDASQYDSVNFKTAGYDTRYKFLNRINEIWLPKI